MDVSYLLVVVVTIAALTGFNAWLLPRRSCVITAEHAPVAAYDRSDHFDGGRGWIGRTTEGRVVIVRAIFGQPTTLVLDRLEGVTVRRRSTTLLSLSHPTAGVIPLRFATAGPSDIWAQMLCGALV